MKELEKITEKIERQEEKKKQAQNEIKLLKRQAKEMKRKADTQRKIRKGGAFESFEREITGHQTETTSEEVVTFLKYVFYKDHYKDKLKEITENKLNESIKDEEERESTEQTPLKN